MSYTTDWCYNCKRSFQLGVSSALGNGEAGYEFMLEKRDLDWKLPVNLSIELIWSVNRESLWRDTPLPCQTDQSRFASTFYSLQFQEITRNWPCRQMQSSYFRSGVYKSSEVNFVAVDMIESGCVYNSANLFCLVNFTAPQSSNKVDSPTTTCVKSFIYLDLQIANTGHGCYAICVWATGKRLVTLREKLLKSTCIKFRVWTPKSLTISQFEAAYTQVIGSNFYRR